MKPCPHNYIENNMTPTHCRDCGEVLVENYEQNHSHTHCWDQKQPSACSIPLEKHTQCCLCDTKNSPKRDYEKEGHFCSICEWGDFPERCVPAGVSQWLEHGKKYGYDTFFEDKFKRDIVEKASAMKRKVPPIYVNGEDVGSYMEKEKAESYNQALQDIITSLQQ